jgi:hypothetical protein
VLSLALSALKARATDEPAGGPRDVERYEQLRAQALDGDPSGLRLGLALLERRGVVAWTRAWRGTASAPARSAIPTRPADNDQLVGVLASMALACVSGS